MRELLPHTPRRPPAATAAAMVVCRYFAQGRCTKGAQCQFEHPGEVTLANSGKPAQHGFPAGRGGHFSARGGFSGGHATQAAAEVKFEDVIKHDLNEVIVEWPLSCYGINASWDVGDNIFHGDFSPEELRMEAYAQMRTMGNIDGYIAMLGQAFAVQQQSRAEVLADPSRAVARSRIPRAKRLAALSAEAAHAMPPGAAPIPPAVPISAHVVPIGVPAAPSGASPQPGSASGDSFSFGKIPELPRQ